ncbi:FimV/HubP family polar landmark protein [Marinobacter algicola]|uniref:FimV/HubP family polar landmark protein n=1 Tax=Marinobacter algicola TaxID=236100 RepID=UPI003BAD279A
MKVRKLAVALALAGGLGSGVAQALGLGEIELQSYLNEPLDADISLRKSEGVDPGDVFVNIAPDSAYERVGIDRSYFLTKLDFRVTTARDGSLVVNVSSREPLREPYLNFLLEVTWPNGRLMREYAVLVDPPVYAEESGMREEVAAPATRQASEPARQQQARSTSQEPRRTTTQRARTLGPTGPSDTLWNIAESVRPDSSVSMQQVMLALQDLNPDAFIAGNINRLKRGEVLRVPDIEQIRSRSRAEANRQVAAQNSALSTPQRAVDATDTAAASGQNGGEQAGGDELRLLASEDSNTRDAEEGGSAGGDGDTAGGVDAGSAVAMEELESARRENDELSGRVDDLQNQVETLQRLLELKNTQLAEMQQAEGDSDQSADAPQTETMSEQAAQEETETSADGDAADMVAEDADVAGSMAADEDAAEPATTDMDETTAADAEEGADAAGMGDDADMTEGEVASDGMDAGTAPAEKADQQEADVAAPASEQPANEVSTSPAEPEKGFPDNIISAITNNPMYQIALGGGLVVLLLLLLLLARRNANREKAFYDQLNSETDAETDTFDLTLDDEDGTDAPDSDPLAEADAYIAYGRMDQAAQSLETAISREPSRTDLRLKLLGVYADTQDRQSFEKQLGEVEALDDDQAIAEAHEMRARLEEAESMPSIDDLESQLRSDSFDTSPRDEDTAFDEPASDRNEPSLDDEAEDEFSSLETDFSDLDETDDVYAEDSEKEPGPDDLIEYDLSGIDASDDKEEPSTDKSEDLADDAFDFSLEDESTEESKASGEDDDLSLDFAEDEQESSETTDESDEFDSLELDEDDLETAGADDSEGQEPEVDSLEEGDLEENDLEESDLDSLDESFLDELDAELDKVAGEDESPADDEQSELDDLELDVSDEDLALMEEFADSGDSAGTDANTDQQKEDSTPLDEELGLEDTLTGEEPADPEQTIAGVEEVEDDLPELSDDDLAAAESAEEESGEPPVASDPASSKAASGADDIDEADLGDDDDFDFLTGTDEASTKLDLARAYVEMGDVDGARDILEEVALEGNEEQKAEAQDLLKNLS